MRTYAQAIKSGDIKDPNKKRNLRMFQKVRQKETKVMRPGKTHKDHNVTKSWGNRFDNQLARAEKK